MKAGIDVRLVDVRIPYRETIRKAAEAQGWLWTLWMCGWRPILTAAAMPAAWMRLQTSKQKINESTTAASRCPFKNDRPATVGRRWATEAHVHAIMVMILTRLCKEVIA